MKSGCTFLCDDVLGRNCILDVFAGGVFLRFLVAGSTISVTLSRGDCLSWRKAFPGMTRCMSIGGIYVNCLATSFLMCGLGCSRASDRKNKRGDLVTSRLARADKMIE